MSDRSNPPVAPASRSAVPDAAARPRGIDPRGPRFAAGITSLLLLIAAFLGLFLWQAGAFFHRNRPGKFDPAAVPPQVLPRP